MIDTQAYIIAAILAFIALLMTPINLEISSIAIFGAGAIIIVEIFTTFLTAFDYRIKGAKK